MAAQVPFLRICLLALVAARLSQALSVQKQFSRDEALSYLDKQPGSSKLTESSGSARTESEYSGSARTDLQGHASHNFAKQTMSYLEEGGLDSDAAKVNTTFAQNDPTSKPRIFLLFLTMSGVERPELWKAFLDGQLSPTMTTHQLSRVFVHCVHSHVCSWEIQTKNTLQATQVATVPSTYCADLVSPMAQLLNSAVLESTSPRDKFVFLSESTLPVKPFAEVYQSLMMDANSDFCVYPTDHWTQLSLANNLHAVIVKHSQWVVLNQAHAHNIVANWPAMKAGFTALTWSIPVYHETRLGPWGKITNPAGVLPLPMCIDEWAFFGTIFGAFVDKGQTQMSGAQLPGLSSTPLHMRGNTEFVKIQQGQCRTFAFWDASEFGVSNLISSIQKDWPMSKFSCYPSCDSYHPAEFEALGDNGAIALRNSRYLFARKFGQYVMTEDQFHRIILAPTAPVPVNATSAWTR